MIFGRFVVLLLFFAPRDCSVAVKCPEIIVIPVHMPNSACTMQNTDILILDVHDKDKFIIIYGNLNICKFSDFARRKI